MNPGASSRVERKRFTDYVRTELTITFWMAPLSRVGSLILALFFSFKILETTYGMAKGIEASIGETSQAARLGTEIGLSIPWMFLGAYFAALIASVFMAALSSGVLAWSRTTEEQVRLA